MDIDFELLTNQGTLSFKGTMDQEEANFVMQFGLLTLLKQGAGLRSVTVGMTPDTSDPSTPPVYN